ncbi:YjbQ family protein [Candidatus Bathyarchaeota archaeon]|nr:YjbQ family protein [Candidatus Bathyarchaeota archaeon]
MNIERIDKKINTQERLQIIDITAQIEEILNSKVIEKGFVSLWIPHTTASITINENDLGLWRDLLGKFKNLVPLEGEYEHKANAHAHILGSIIKPVVHIPVFDGRMVLGTWQRILFIELDGPRERSVIVTISS